MQQIYNVSEMQVVSWHHQAVSKLGAGIEATVHAPDGLVEAIEIPLYPSLCVGVQWHPETQVSGSDEQEKLFDYFVASCNDAISLALGEKS